MELERVVLERLKVAAQTAVTRQVLEQADLQMVADHLTDQLVVRLQAYVLAEHLADQTQTAELRVPASASAHFWHTHPRAFAWWQKWVWLLRPPAMVTHTLTTTWTDRAVYPHAQLRLPPEPKLGPVVLWRTATSHLEDFR